MDQATAGTCDGCGAQRTSARPGGPLNMLTHRASCPTKAALDRSTRLDEERERLDREVEREIAREEREASQAERDWSEP
jgi:hypothetical protein